MARERNEAAEGEGMVLPPGQSVKPARVGEPPLTGMQSHIITRPRDARGGHTVRLHVRGSNYMLLRGGRCTVRFDPTADAAVIQQLRRDGYDVTLAKEVGNA